MPFFFFGLAIAIGIVDWFAVARGWRRVEYVAKPATMLALLAFVGMNGGFGPLGDSGTTMLWFAVGLLFCLAGDVFLMLPKNFFIAGLIAFLTGHIFYIIGFNPLPPLKPPQLLVAGIVTLLVLLTSTQLYRRIAQGLEHGGNHKLKMPVLVYTLVISVMLISAIFTLLRGGWKPFHSLAATAGAALFYLSDAILAWDRFVCPLPNGRVKNMITYHSGQFLLTLGAALHFLPKNL
jgi:uncharacterized membrane protein YhhN